MKRLFWIVLAMLAPSITAFGQVAQVVVTGNVLNATSGYVQFILQPQNTGIQFFIQNIGTFAPQMTTCAINSSGQIVGMTTGSCLVWGNDAITPANTLYQVVFAPGGVITNRVNRELITGVTYNLNTPVFGNPVNIVPQYQTITAPPVSVNLIPQGNNAFTLGSAGQYWASGYISNLFVNTLTINGSSGNSSQCNQGTGSTDLYNKIVNAYAKSPDGGTIDCSSQPPGQNLSADPFVAMTKHITIIMPPGTTTSAIPLHIPSNVDYKQPIGGCLDNSAMTQFDGNIEAGVYQIFCGPGQVTAPNATGYFQWWGAQGNGIILGGVDPKGNAIGVGSGCTGTATTFTVTCTTANFTQLDIGKAFDLAHASTSNCNGAGYRYFGGAGGPFNCNLVGTIVAVPTSTTATLSVALVNNVTNEQFAYATLDDLAVVAAINSKMKQIETLGTFGLGRGNTFVMQNQTIFSPGLGLGRFLVIGPVAYATAKPDVFFINNGTINATLQNLQFLGTNEAGELNTFGPTPDLVLFCTGIPMGLGGGCNSNSGINNVRVINCDFSHSWGIGFHVPGGGSAVGQQVNNFYLVNSTASWNSYDGWNPVISDGLFITGINGSNNGTGGIETIVNAGGSITITGSQFNGNKNGGAAIGGFGDGLSHLSSCTITGNTFNSNGNGSTVTTTGQGLLFGDGVQNCTVQGNTFWHNNLIGLQIQGGAQDQNYVITGNIISSNGIIGATSNTYGIYGDFRVATINDNLVTDESTAIISTATRASNVVTVTTRNPHNYQTGYMVGISGSPAGWIDGTWTITSVADDEHFTFAQTAANAGPTAGGTAYSTGSGFTQNIGIGINSSVDTRFGYNTVRNQHTRNYGLDNCVTNCLGTLVATDTNVPSSTDLYIGSTVPSLTGLTIRIPDIQTTTNACTTAAAAGSTCTVIITHNLNTTPNNTVCSLDNTPIAQSGTPFILKVDSSTSANTATVTIGNFTAVGSGGGTMRCRTNYAQ